MRSRRTALAAAISFALLAGCSRNAPDHPTIARRQAGTAHPRAQTAAAPGSPVSRQLGSAKTPPKAREATAEAGELPLHQSGSASEPFLRVRPNELGFIPILMYHAIGGPAIGHRPRYDRHGLNIRPDTFRKQLEMMYRANWYPVNVRDITSPQIVVPAGKIPVALTFDDARGSQFRYLKDGSIDPQCAVGILLAFHRKHPDWPLRATFYVMGRSKWNPVPFYQPGLDGKKLQWLVEQGFEIGNHSTSHRLFSHLDPATERWEIAECDRYVRARAPNATMDTFALPGGGKPRSHAGWEAVMYGKACGVVYRHKAVLLAWGGPSPAPASKKFDRWRIPRIGAEPGNIEYWIHHLSPGGRTPAFVSDGMPNVVSAPRKYAGWLGRNLPPSLRVVAYELQSPPSGNTNSAAAAPPTLPIPVRTR